MPNYISASEFLDGMPPTTPDANPKQSFGQGSVSDRSKAGATDTTSDLNDSVSVAAIDAMAQASALASAASAKVGDAIETAKAGAADAAAGAARNIGAAAQSVEERSPKAASAVRNAAGGADRLSHSLRDLKLSELNASIAGFAKRQPLAVAGLGMVAGYVLARLISGPSRSA